LAKRWSKPVLAWLLTAGGRLAKAGNYS
jgi:hypothetical protein